MSILSAGVHSPYTNFSDLGLVENYSLSNVANATGYYNDLAFDYLAEQQKDNQIQFIPAAPGIVATKWVYIS